MPDLGQPNGEVCNPTVRRERSDASLSAILKWGLGLAIGAVVVLFILSWLFDYFSARENRQKESALAVVAQERTEGGDAATRRPLLEGIRPGNPDGTISHWQPGSGAAASETSETPPFAWVDAKGGVVRVPVEVAMRVALANKSKYFPVRPAKAKEDKP